jgi:DNA-binding transcriptional MocR family regulator
VIDLMGRQPSWPSAVVKLWSACVAEAAAQPLLWAEPAPQGDDLLRDALGRDLGVEPSRLTITSGTRAAAVTYARTARHLLMERPTFAGARFVLQSGSAQRDHVSWDYLCTARLPASSTIWLTSPGRNPDGATLSAEQAAQLAARVAEGHRVVVNGTYAWWAPAAPVPSGADRVGSLSKLAGMGARIGWVDSESFFGAAPPELLGTSPSRVWQRAWALCIERAGLQQLRMACIDPSASAAQAFTEQLRRAGLPVVAAAGPSRLLALADGWTEERACAHLAGLGCLVAAGRDFFSWAPSIRLNFMTATMEQAVEAAGIVATSGTVDCTGRRKAAGTESAGRSGA